MLKLVSNKIRCKFCGDILESFTVNDFKQCRCGKCSTDGGHEYAQRSFDGKPEDVYEDLSIYIDTDTNKLLTPKEAEQYQNTAADLKAREVLKDIAELTPEEKKEEAAKVIETNTDIPKGIEEQRDEPKKKPTRGRYDWGTGETIKEE